jgi:hypothetical protein
MLAIMYLKSSQEYLRGKKHPPLRLEKLNILLRILQETLKDMCREIFYLQHSPHSLKHEIN